MGSYGVYRKPGLSNREFFEHELPEILVNDGQVVAESCHATEGEWDRVWYAAVRDHTTGEVWALIVTMHGNRDTFVYKPIDETQGPVECHPSKRVLDALTPTDRVNAVAWRDKARRNVDLLRQAKAIKPGTVIQFPAQIRFGDGTVEDRFRYVAGDRFTRVSDGHMVRLGRSWRTLYKFSIEPAA